MATFSRTVQPLLLTMLTGVVILLATGCGGAIIPGPQAKVLLERNNATKAQIASIEREMASVRQESAALEERISLIYTQMDQEAAKTFLYRDHVHMELATGMLLDNLMGAIDGIQGQGPDFRFTLTAPKFQTQQDSLAFSARYTIQSDSGTCSGTSNGNLSPDTNRTFRVSGFQVSCRTGKSSINSYLSGFIPALEIPVRTAHSMGVSMERTGDGFKRNVNYVEMNVPVTIQVANERVLLRVPSITLTGRQ